MSINLETMPKLGFGLMRLPTVEKEIDEWDVYAREIIWYGKRRSATLLTNPREHIEYSEL